MKKQISAKIDKQLFDKIEKLAKQNKRSLTKEVELAIEKYLKL